MLYLSSTYIFLKTFLSPFDKLISVEVLLVVVDRDLATAVVVLCCWGVETRHVSTAVITNVTPQPIYNIQYTCVDHTSDQQHSYEPHCRLLSPPQP